MEKLFIKNMVCDRCKLVVNQEFQKLGIKPLSTTLGMVELQNLLSEEQRQQIKSSLELVGFELLDDKKSLLIEKIKNVIIDVVHHNKNKPPKANYSDYIAQQIGKDYSYLSGLFSEIEGITIEHYIINQKIERVKELLVYNELTLSQIAMEMDYSSIAHLSNQFKKVTGLTPSHFKKIGILKRKALDQI
ncbi:MAG TPA: AraC family transcriptional regulator [Cyclobacteriaceae bacterium]|jgi:AraC-like DNA-binding protein|nr:AraC family transcriptional regulator [Cyclobacteriaceae bacterium]